MKTDLVTIDSLHHCGIAVWIQIIGPDKHTLLPSWDREGSYACHNITHHFSGFEGVHKSLVLRLQSTVPVNLRIIELEYTILFAELNIHVVRAGKYFVSKSSKLGMRSYVVDFVDHSSNCWILIYQNFCYNVFVGQIFVPKI